MSDARPPRTGDDVPGDLPGPDGLDGLRDARLTRALAHAPDADLRPPARLRSAIQEAAAQAVRPAATPVVPPAPASRPPATPPRTHWLDRWRALWHDLGHLGRGGQAAFATLLIGVLAVLMWRQAPLPDDMHGTPASTAESTRPDTDIAAPAKPAAPPPIASNDRLEPPALARQKPMEREAAHATDRLAERAAPATRAVPSTPVAPPTQATAPADDAAQSALRDERRRETTPLAKADSATPASPPALASPPPVAAAPPPVAAAAPAVSSALRTAPDAASSARAARSAPPGSAATAPAAGGSAMNDPAGQTAELTLGERRRTLDPQQATALASRLSALADGRPSSAAPVPTRPPLLRLTQRDASGERLVVELWGELLRRRTRNQAEVIVDIDADAVARFIAEAQDLVRER